MVISLYEKFFFQSDVGAYPMFHMPSLIAMPGFFSMRALDKQPMGEEHLARKEPVPIRKALRSARTPGDATAKAILIAAAATAATKAAPAAATKLVGPKGLETKASSAVAKARVIAAEEDAKALQAREVWTRSCGKHSKDYHPVTRLLESLLESIPTKGKLADTHPHTRTPAYPLTKPHTTPPLLNPPPNVTPPPAVEWSLTLFPMSLELLRAARAACRGCGYHAYETRAFSWPPPYLICAAPPHRGHTRTPAHPHTRTCA